MKYKILYLTFHPEIGGGETILLSLLSKLDKRFFEPIVIVTKPGQLSKALKKLEIKTYILPLNGYSIRTLFVPGASPTGIYKFLKLAQKIKPDIIHLNHLNFAVYAGAVGKILKIPIVATAHGSWDSIYFFQDLINQIFVDKILANTSEVASNLLKRKIINSNKVKVIHFGVDTQKFRPGNKFKVRKLLGLPEGKKVVTIVGRIDPVKDHLTFLRAADKVQRSYSNVLFLVVGSSLGDFSKMIGKGEIQHQMKNFLQRNPSLTKSVTLKEFVDYNSMPDIYNASDILVSSSLSESFGLSLAEAASSEVPIVATNKGGQNLIVKQGSTGYLVPPKDPEALAKKINLLLADKQKRIKFGKAGRRHIVKNFSLESYVKKMQKEYFNIIRKDK